MEVVKNIHVSVINQSFHKIQLHALCAATCQFFLFGILYSVIIGIDVVRTTVALGSEILGADILRVVCKYSIVGCDESYVLSHGKADDQFR
jgi:hypothetical protein